MASLRNGVKTIEHGTWLDMECVDLMKKNNAILVPTRWICHELVGKSEFVLYFFMYFFFGKPQTSTAKKQGNQTKQTKKKKKPSQLSDESWAKGQIVAAKHLEALKLAIDNDITIACGLQMFTFFFLNF